MAEPTLEQLRSGVFQGLVRNAFTPYGATTLHRLSRGLWRPVGEDLPSHLKARDTGTFAGFMGAVEARGRRVGLLRPGIDMDDANSVALVEILANAAQFEPYATVEVLGDQGVQSWSDLVAWVSSVADSRFSESQGGRVPEDFVSPPAADLYEVIRENRWPSPKVLEAFSISTPRHYASIYYPIRAGELTSQDLDETGGDLDALTRLVNRMPSNPYKDIRFVAIPGEKRRRSGA